MMKKLIAASIALAIMAAIVPAALAEGATVQPYNGPIGADSPLYSLKIFAQKMDVFLTFNDNDKMKKQMSYADERLSEAEAAFQNNDSGALETALGEYDSALDDLNNTTQAPGINDSDYAYLAPMLYHHQMCFYGMMNNSSNSTVPMRIQDRMMICYNQTIRLKNGMPFYYYNGTAYFLPPGQADKIVNGSKVPPGLGKKGYVGPVPTITNGSMNWPWDEMNYSYGNKTVPTPDKFNNGNGNGKGPNNGNSNGNGNANGHGNGNGNGNGNNKK
jgi:hypothetical protein